MGREAAPIGSAILLLLAPAGPALAGVAIKTLGVSLTIEATCTSTPAAPAAYTALAGDASTDQQVRVVCNGGAPHAQTTTPVQDSSPATSVQESPAPLALTGTQTAPVQTVVTITY